MPNYQGIIAKKHLATGAPLEFKARLGLLEDSPHIMDFKAGSFLNIGESQLVHEFFLIKIVR